MSSARSAAFLRTYDELPEDTRRLLLLAAASGSEDLAVLARAAGELGLSVDALDSAEQAGLVRIDSGSVAFRHPLARSAVYAQAGGRERRESHAVLARTLSDRDVDRRAWHLAAASVGPDRVAAAALAQAGARALGRNAYAVSATAFERAARLTPQARARSSLFLAASESAWLAGDADRTLRLLDEAEVDEAETASRAQIAYLRGQVAMRRGPLVEGYRLMVEAAELAGDREEAVTMLAHAVRACFYSGDTPAMLAAAGRAAALANGGEGSERTAFFAAMAHCMSAVAGGRGDEGIEAGRRAVEILERSPELRDNPRLLGWAGLAPLWLREADAGRGLLERAFEQARTESALGLLPGLLHVVARDHATTDRWLEAEASYDEAIRLARETGQRVELAAALAGVAWLEGRQGREAVCRAHARDAEELCAELGVGLYGAWVIQALGHLELALGNAAKAVEEYRRQLAEMDSLEITDVDLSPAPELVDALLRLGRRDEAVALAADHERMANAKGQPWALARAKRVRGLLAADDEIDAAFAEALALHARTLDVFETARTQLAYGARLRRARRRVEAREHLRAASEALARLGAATWADTAAAELAATGETARRRDVTTLDELTPQELQIALLLAQGKTTREAAAAVFLSPKTVEYHLRHVYRKLGIRSREELAAAFSS